MLHYLITNREILTDSKGEYIREDGLDRAGEASETLRFASFDSTKFEKTSNCRKSVTLLPDLHLIEKKILRGLKKKGDLLCYIHGFHTDFREVLEDICELEQKYIHSDSPIEYIIALTWPSRDSLFAYADDARDAEQSGYTFARRFNMLTDFFQLVTGSVVCNIHLLAHSMGNRVLEHMLYHLASQQGFTFNALFREVVLAAADIDWDGFEETNTLARLKLMSQRITVYYHGGDIALFLSEKVKNKKKRLGKHGFKDHGKIDGNIYSIDCTSVEDHEDFIGGIIEHSYYKFSNATINDIIWVLKGKEAHSFVEEALRTNKPSSQRDFILKI